VHRHAGDLDAKSRPTGDRSPGAVPGDPRGLLGLQRTAGNAAVTGLLQAGVPAATAQRDTTDTAQQPKWDITSVVDEAMDRSPTFYRICMTIFRRGYHYEWGEWGKGTFTNNAEQLIVIDPSVTRAQAVVRVMYEAGNAFWEDDFAAIKKALRQGKYPTGEAYARAVIDEEAGTAVNASKEALEAGLTYSTRIDAIVKAGTQPDPADPNALTWKKGVTVGSVVKKVGQMLWDSATTVDSSGATVLARDHYAQQWRALTLQQKQP
jgi:hypothetical protein